MILYIEDPKDATRKLLELINEFCKVNTQKFVAFLYTNNERSEREIQEAILFTTALKRVKYLRINLPKKTTDLYSKNYKMLMKKNWRRHKQMERYTMFMDWMNQYGQNDYTIQGNLQIQCSPYQITNDIFHRTRTKKSQHLYGDTKDTE